MSRRPRRFRDGKETPEELHVRVALGGKTCSICGQQAWMRCVTFYPLKEAMQARPEYARMAVTNPAKFSEMVLQLKIGVYVPVSGQFACKDHRADLERAAAKAPSWAIVDFFYPPKNEAIISMHGHVT